jgi:hypothetical protein
LQFAVQATLIRRLQFQTARILPFFCHIWRVWQWHIFCNANYHCPQIGTQMSAFATMRWNSAKTRCPVCRFTGEKVWEEGAQADRPPQAGDVSLCGICGEFLVLTKNLQFRHAKVEDLMKMKPLHQLWLQTVQQKIRLGLYNQGN